MYTKEQIEELKRKQAVTRETIRQARKEYDLEQIRTTKPETRPKMTFTRQGGVLLQCAKCGRMEPDCLEVVVPAGFGGTWVDQRPKSKLGARIGGEDWKMVRFPRTRKEHHCGACRGIHPVAPVLVQKEHEL